MKTFDQAWLDSFVHESNEIDPQPGFKNEPGSPRWDDHLKALTLAVQAGQELTIAKPRSIHRILMGRMWPKIAGQLRTVDVMVGSRICPPYREVPKMLVDLVNTFTTLFQNNDENLAQPPEARLARVWQAHLEFENIHPFQDGNGRTGRILMVNHALLLGVEPPLIKFADRFEYYRRFD